MECPGESFMKNSFGTRLKKLRAASGLTQSDVAKKLNKSTSTIRMWELGNNEPDINTLVALSVMFDCSLDYLLCRDQLLGCEGAVRTRLPVFSLSAYSEEAEADFFKSIPSDYLDGGDTFIIIKNDLRDMCPLIPENAYVLIKKSDSCFEGNTVLVEFAGKYYLRKVKFCNGGILFLSADGVQPILFAECDSKDFVIYGTAVEYNSIL